MNDITLGLIIVAVTGVLVGLIFILVYFNNKKRDLALQSLSSQNGWIYEKINEPHTSGYRLRKHEWIIEGVNTSETESRNGSTTTEVISYTRWFSGAVRLPQGIVMIGSRVPDAFFNRLGVAVLLSASGLLTPAENEMIKDIHSIELGSLELMGRFMIWTNQDETAKRMIDSEVEAAMLNWPASLAMTIRYSNEGLEVKIRGRRIYKEQDLYALVKLGNALLNSGA